MRHDTDPTPPEGIPRPPAGDLARAWLTDNAGATEHDRAVLATLTLALDSLALVTRLYLWGDAHTLDAVVVAGARDLFGWRDCSRCREITHPDDWDARGCCSSCADDTTDDDQDRDAYGAPYGGRDDLDDLGNPFGGALDR